MAYKTLFVRIGYMRYYQGPQIGDEKPIGGGAFNEKNIGLEAYNFQKDEEGWLYGYFEVRDGDSLHLEKIDRGYKNRDCAEDVLVIYIHEMPKTKPKLYVIAGWHRNATVYRDRKCRPESIERCNPHPCYNKTEELDCNIVAEFKNSFLLPVCNRIKVKKEDGVRKGFFGESNFYYTQDGRGNDRAGQNEWIYKALSDVEEYERNGGVNILVDQDPDDVSIPVQNDEVRRQGQGIMIDSVSRKNIELHAMGRAEKWFKEHYRIVDDVSSHCPYDLLCREKIHENDDIPNEIRVEVKGTQSKAERVILTKNEVDSAKENKSALFVTHSIKIDEGEVSNGKDFVIFPWDIEGDGALKPVRYTYAIDINRSNARMH